MDLKLKGAHAAIAGGSKGIGKAVVRALLREGCAVRFFARDKGAVRQTAEEYAEFGELEGHSLDGRDREAVDRWFAEQPPPDLAVTCLSALSGAWEDAIAVDLEANLNVMRVAETHLRSPGSFTYVGSKASSVATPGFEAYGAAKAAMVHCTASLAARLTPRGIRVNVLSPGDTFVPGGFWDHIKRESPELYASTVAENPLGRFARPEEIAAAVVFLASPAASFVSGANWYVHGGAQSGVQF